MKEITIDELKKIASQYGLKACKVKGSEVVNIRKKPNSNQTDITWEEFERILNEKGLAVYKAEKSDFIKIMKKK